MSVLLYFVAVVVAWAVLLRSVLFEYIAAFPRVVAKLTTVVAGAGEAGLFDLTASALRCRGNGAAFRLKISALIALWPLSRLPLVVLATVVLRLLWLLVSNTAVLTISMLTPRGFIALVVVVDDTGLCLATHVAALANRSKIAASVSVFGDLSSTRSRDC